MSFLSPLFLLGTFAAVVPVLLHLLRRDRGPRVKFAAVALLKDAPVARPRGPRISDPWLLALRVAALVLLAAAFAHPYLTSGRAARAGATMVALDTSYSMNAPGRFARARALAEQAIARAPAEDVVGLVTFDDLARVVVPPTGDRAAVRRAVDSVEPGSGATRYRAAIDAALSGSAGGRTTIAVVTDLQAGGWEPGQTASVPASTQIEILDVGPPPPNVAVTGVGDDDGRVTATIRNTGTSARTTRVGLTIDGRPGSSRVVSVGSRGSIDVAFGAVRAGAAIAVTVDDPGGLQADNVRYAIAGSSRASVLVVTTGPLEGDAFYVNQALTASSSEAPAYRVIGMHAVDIGGREDAGARSVDAILLLSTRGLDRRGRARLAGFVRRGGGLLVAAGPDVDGALVQDVLAPSTHLRLDAVAEASSRVLVVADPRHPVFAPFAGNSDALAPARFSRIAQLSGERCAALARFTTGEPALLECPFGDGRVMVFASDLDRAWNDLPLHPGFVPFLHETVGYLAGPRGRRGRYVVGDLPAGRPRTAGVTSLDGIGQTAVNVDARESDPRRLSPEAFQSMLIRSKDDGGEGGRLRPTEQDDRQHLWRYLLGIMIVVLAAESALASRTGR